MGTCMSSGNRTVIEGDKATNGDAGQSEEECQSHQDTGIEENMSKAKVRKPVKVLLLGPGDSGKSTIVRQIRLAHRTPFSAHEIEDFRQLIYVNLTTGLESIIDEMERFGLAVTPANRSMVRLLKLGTDLKDYEPFPEKYREVLRRIWEDPNVQAAYAYPKVFSLADYLPYYYADLDRFFEPSYVPSEADIAHAYSRTLGIAEQPLRDHSMLVVDVGGQRSERKKWVHGFPNMTSVVFVASLSGYDQFINENQSGNQMFEAICIWKVLCSSRWFGPHLHMILLLNKNDLFERKIQTSHIEFDGEKGDAEAGREFFKKIFADIAAESKPKRNAHI